MSAGDYRLFRPENPQNRSLETGCQFAKARHWRAFLRILRALSRSAVLPGWRRSADRNRLHAISLLSGNLTGNFVILRHLETVLEQKTVVPQGLLRQFPTQVNRENISTNRELFAGIRELLSIRRHSRNFLHACFLAVRTRSVLTDKF
jgi:hypothetical protein